MAVDNQKLKKAGLKAGAWNFATTIINQLRNFIVSLVLARLLDPTDFGLLGMATAFVGIVDAFVDFGLGAAIIQKKDVTDKQTSTVFYLNLMMGGIFALIMFLCSGLIADFFHEQRLKAIVKVLSATFLVKALQVMPNVSFRRKLDYKTPFKISITSGISTGIIGVLMAFWGFGVWALVFSQILGWFISLGMLWYYSKWKPILYFNFREIRDLWKMGYKLSLSIAIDQVFNRLNTILIGRFFSAAVLGLYYRAGSLNKLVIQYSFTSFSGVLFPTLSKCQDDLSLLRYNIVKIVKVVSFLTFLFSGLMILSSYEIITILYGTKWDGAVAFFSILGLFSITETIPTILVNGLMAVGRTDINLKVEIIKKTVYIVAIPIGLKFGIYGYVWATCLAALISMPLNMWSLRYIQLSMMPQFKSIATYFIPFITMVALDKLCLPVVLFGNQFLSLLVKSVSYVALYLGYNAIFQTEGLSSAISLCTPFVNKLRIAKFNR